MYTGPDENKPCSLCEYREYDSFHYEMWCGHKPKPEGIGPKLIIGQWGTCEHWDLCE